MTRIGVEHTWNGLAAAPGECVSLEVEVTPEHLCLRVDAPHHGDPLPPLPPGPCDGLWEYEVVELFLLGADEHYLEIELGPGGHFLLLDLERRRVRARTLLPARHASGVRGARWQAELWIAHGDLPDGLRAWNAYAIHGTGAQRRYLAFAPVPGERPDFHRLECFAPVPAELRAALARASE